MTDASPFLVPTWMSAKHQRDAALLTAGYLLPSTPMPRVQAFSHHLALLFAIDDLADTLSLTADAWWLLHCALQPMPAPPGLTDGNPSLLPSLLEWRINSCWPADPVLAAQLWCPSLAFTFQAWRWETSLQPGSLSPEEARAAFHYYTGLHAAYSAAVPSIVMAALSTEVPLTACGFHRPEVWELLITFARCCRLENDLRSVEKERLEPVAANAVLLAEVFLTREDASRTVVEALEVLQDQLSAQLQRLEPQEPVVQLIDRMMATHARWYTQQTTRYTVG